MNGLTDMVMLPSLPATSPVAPEIVPASVVPVVPTAIAPTAIVPAAVAPAGMEVAPEARRPVALPGLQDIGIARRQSGLVDGDLRYRAADCRQPFGDAGPGSVDGFGRDEGLARSRGKRGGD